MFGRSSGGLDEADPCGHLPLAFGERFGGGPAARGIQEVKRRRFFLDLQQAAALHGFFQGSDGIRHAFGEILVPVKSGGGLPCARSATGHTG